MSKATVLACAVVSLLVAGGTATAANLVTSSDIRNGTIISEDIKKGGVKNKNIKKATIKLNRLDKSTQDKINQGGPAGPQGIQGIQGPPGPPAATEFGVATVFVDRGSGPSRWATYSVPLGSPTGSTTGGHFRFTCTPEQAPCKLSLGAAVISTATGPAAFYPRVLIHSQSGATAGAPMTFCEYADGANNNVGIDQVSRVPNLAAAITAMQVPRNMGIGGSLDCGATGQPPPAPFGVVTAIWVPAASLTDSAFYDVWTTLGFGGIATQPEDNN